MPSIPNRNGDGSLHLSLALSCNPSVHDGGNKLAWHNSETDACVESRVVMEPGTVRVYVDTACVRATPVERANGLSYQDLVGGHQKSISSRGSK